MIQRETEMLQTFARLADTLVDDFDVLDLMQTLVEACTELLPVTAAGILLLADDGQLELAASTSEANRIVESMQLSAEAGPCIESFSTGRIVSVPSIAEVPAAWSAFRDSALAQGFTTAHAIPMRLRQTTIGTLNLMNVASEPLGAEAIMAGKALADVATIGILQERALRESGALSAQLQTALDSRVVIEQAKGVVAQTHDVTIERAFEIIRSYARQHRSSLGDVARAVVERRLAIPR
ncbi:MAG: GAF and ANTAR domain-containing protein [Microbacteriaceae bacterium]